MGTKNWDCIAENVANRTGKQCCDRWYNRLAKTTHKFAAENAGMQSKSTEPGSTAEEAEEPKANQNASVRNKVSASKHE